MTIISVLLFPNVQNPVTPAEEEVEAAFPPVGVPTVEAVEEAFNFERR